MALARALIVRVEWLSILVGHGTFDDLIPRRLPRRSKAEPARLAKDDSALLCLFSSRREALLREAAQSEGESSLPAVQVLRLRCPFRQLEPRLGTQPAQLLNGRLLIGGQRFDPGGRTRAVAAARDQLVVQRIGQGGSSTLNLGPTFRTLAPLRHVATTRRIGDDAMHGCGHGNDGLAQRGRDALRAPYRVKIDAPGGGV